MLDQDCGFRTMEVTLQAPVAIGLKPGILGTLLDGEEISDSEIRDVMGAIRRLSSPDLIKCISQMSLKEFGDFIYLCTPDPEASDNLERFWSEVKKGLLRS